MALLHHNETEVFLNIKLCRREHFKCRDFINNQQIKIKTFIFIEVESFNVKFVNQFHQIKLQWIQLIFNKFT